jgi:hypothetical protein
VSSSTEHLVALLEAHRYDESSEDALQRGVAQVLAGAGVEFTREVQLGYMGRIDFLMGKIGLECKVGGGLSAVTRQLHRYAAHTNLDALVLVTTRAQLARVPRVLHGKPVAVVLTMGGLA